MLKHRTIDSVTELQPGEVVRYELDGGMSAVVQEDAYEVLTRAREAQVASEVVVGQADVAGTEGGGSEDMLGR